MEEINHKNLSSSILKATVIKMDSNPKPIKSSNPKYRNCIIQSCSYAEPTSKIDFLTKPTSKIDFLVKPTSRFRFLTKPSSHSSFLNFLRNRPVHTTQMPDVHETQMEIRNQISASSTSNIIVANSLSSNEVMNTKRLQYMKV